MRRIGAPSAAMRQIKTSSTILHRSSIECFGMDMIFFDEEESPVVGFCCSPANCTPSIDCEQEFFPGAGRALGV